MKNTDSYMLSPETVESAKQIFLKALDLGVDFKLQKNVKLTPLDNLDPSQLIDTLPKTGKPLDEVLAEFEQEFLPFCYNFASPHFMGFPDAGNSVAAITGNIIADFLQQNLINQSFCSPSGTFAEIAVLQWLREIVGYTNKKHVDTIFEVGGVVTPGGTTSNAIGIMLARENFRPRTMQRGVNPEDGYYIVVPKGIGHYSVKSAQMWIGCGNKLIEVETRDFRYDLIDLEKKLRAHKGKIMGLVAYAGDSRTMAVDNFKAIHKLVKSIDPGIWLHADACHGFSLGFSDTLREKLDGIELFDSITTDPHKVMNSPYAISTLLVKNPETMKTVSSLSDLIMQEQYAFGQITPFIGSKPWSSLKLWFAMKHLGREGFGRVIDDRHTLAVTLADILMKDKDFLVINKVDINAVAFMYTGSLKSPTVTQLNELNKGIHARLIEEGIYHLHQFSVPDQGLLKKGELLYPLRFMSGNPLTTGQHLQDMIRHIRTIGNTLERASA